MNEELKTYLLIGNGRMARHTQCYFQQLAIPYSHWHRKQHTPLELQQQLKIATHVLILINDDAIDPFIEAHQLHQQKGMTLVHFSGSLNSVYAYSAHPLNTFTLNDTHTRKEYEQIPFVIADDGPPFFELLPGLNNPHYCIPQESKPYYHAMCVLANNVTTLLWQKFYREMQTRFSMEEKHLKPFLERTFKNIYANPETALTGPLARKDKQTLQKNWEALKHDEFQSLFQTLINQIP